MADRIAILFGTETGNAEDCANELGEDLTKAGFHNEVIDMDDVSADDLTEESLVFIITSTFGNGDPPANAYELLNALRDGGLDFSGVDFAVCGLGDRTYKRFAQCGKDFDAELENLGGNRVIERQDCDVEFDVPFESWKEKVVAYLEERDEFRGATPPPKAPSMSQRLTTWVGGLFGGKKGEPAPVAADAAAQTAPTAAKPVKISREAPWPAKLVDTRLLSGPGSTKETRHYAIDLSGSGLTYQAGDSFGVLPENCPDEVAEVIGALGLDADAAVTTKAGASTLAAVLMHRDLQTPRMAFTKRLAKGGGALADALQLDEAALSAWLHERHLADLIASTEASDVSAQELVDGLRPMPPRLYSIASSPTRHPEEVHFTVETLRYEAHGRKRKGVATCWLADRVGEGGTVPLYLHANDAFRLPEADVPVILIGPGTGIAPFRAFLQQREDEGATGDNWLIFGHRNQAHDFLYGDELTSWKLSGLLTRLDLAWSRDTDAKVYVQDKVRAAADDVVAWLERGAHVYVCGDALGMAPGVWEAFKAVAQDELGMDDDAAEAWLQGLVDDGRYHLDVY